MRLTINSQDLNKAHGHDMIGICMLKLCGEAACFFKMCVNTSKLPSECKKGNVVSIHEKDDK